jgi:Replicative DNA helicase
MSDKQFYRAKDEINSVIKNREKNFERGILTGFHTLDEIISFKIGYSSLLFSYAHTGKSVLALDLLVGICEREPDTVISIFSPEFRTREELISAVVQQKLGLTLYGQYKNHVSDGDFIEALQWVSDRFIFLERPKRTKENPLAPVTITDVFRLCKEAEIEYGCKIKLLFIDPANYISRSSEESKMSVQDYVLHLHDTIADYSLALKVHTILSSHCRDVELIVDKDSQIKYYPIPHVTDIMGGQSNARGGYQLIALWRNPEGVINKATGMPYPANAIDVICCKAKPFGSGALGTRTIYFNPRTHKMEEEIAGVRYGANEYYNKLTPTANTLKPSSRFDSEDLF